MVDGSSDWAVTASAMPVALALCSYTLNPAANIGVAGAMAMAPSAITPHACQLKAPRLRIPWILLAIESVDGACPPAVAGGDPSRKAGLVRLARKSIRTVAPKRPGCQTHRSLLPTGSRRGMRVFRRGALE